MKGRMQDFLERNGAPGFSRGVYAALTVLFILFMAAYAAISLAVAIKGSALYWFFRYDEAAKLLAITAAALVLCAMAAGQLLGARPWLAACCVFLLALAPRLMLSLWIDYIPTGDMDYYFKMGQAYAAGELSVLRQTAEGYGIPDFLGMGVLFGVVAKLFSPTTAGFAVCHSLVTAGIATLVYLIGARYDRRAGLFGALLYAIYPASIVMTQCTTNQHFNTLFGLCAVLLLLMAADSRRLLFGCFLAAGAGALLVAAQFAHPSTATTRIAILLFLLLLVIAECADKKRAAGRLALICSFVLALVLTKSLCYGALARAGLYDASQYGSSGEYYLFKIAVGLNPETGGSLPGEGYLAVPEGETYTSMILADLSDPKTLLRTLVRKTATVWGTRNGAFDLLRHGLFVYGLDTPYFNEPYALTGLSYAKLYDTLGAWAFIDHAMQSCVYVLAGIGAFLRRRTGRALDLVLLVLLGWMGAHVLIEAGARYNYYAMPYLFLMAGVGISECARAQSARRAGKKKEKSNRC